MTYGRVLETKLVNALVPEAEAKPLALPYLPVTTWLSIMRWFKTRHRGLWVGGEAKITNSHFVFEPNYLNKQVHVADTSFALPLSAITGVTVEPGFITKIVAIATAERVHRIRCFGAAAFAQSIRRRAAEAAKI